MPFFTPREPMDQPEFSTGRSDHVEKVRAAAIRTYELPVYPRLSLLLFISMLVLTAAMVAVDIRNFFVYSARTQPLRLLQNLSLSALCCWGIHSLFLVPVCLLGMRRSRRDYEARKQKAGIVDDTDEERARSGRAVRRLNARFRRFLLLDGIGLLLFALLFAASRC